ncbi:MYND-type domain-containing protein [Mycena sanguinolenta]|uniref:MYND-type domain-containing protein n=1 Tax=Mycena sanguinolenta TaxID=230812 RepID=A0A8H6ZAV3_9AGAR|nr:MYND-type domain-containing protein [Mycena sanguinolenta]
MEEPKVGTACVACFDEEASKSLMRCSTCKNRFYCVCIPSSQAIAKPIYAQIDGLPVATFIEINDEFDGAVKRAAGILRELQKSMYKEKEFHPDVSPAMLAPLLRFPDDLPSHLQYRRPIEHSVTFKYRLPLITATRLFLVAYVAGLARAPAQRQKYLDWFTHIPPDWGQMHGPKIVGRPADLSPGEYMVLAESMVFWMMPEVEMALQENGGLVDGNGEEGERHTAEVDVAQERGDGRV